MSDGKTVVRRWLEEGLAGGELSALAETISRDVVFHSGPSESTRGTDELLSVVAEYRTAFPDLSVIIEEQIAEDDRVATRFRVSGTNLGEIGGMDPTGNRVSVQVINIVRIDDGRIAEVWSETDSFEVLQQLGLV
jgi:steroid delta-isomerase-like uncharacterized protein